MFTRCIRCNRDVRGRSHVFMDSTGMEGPYCAACADVIRARRDALALASEAARRNLGVPRDGTTAQAA